MMAAVAANIAGRVSFVSKSSIFYLFVRKKASVYCAYITAYIGLQRHMCLELSEWLGLEGLWQWCALHVPATSGIQGHAAVGIFQRCKKKR